MIVSAYECRGRAPSLQRNVSSTTRLRGTCAAESAVPGASRSPPAAYPSTSGPKRTVPASARAYGSSSSLAGLQRTPRAGSYGPVARYP